MINVMPIPRSRPSLVERKLLTMPNLPSWLRVLVVIPLSYPTAIEHQPFLIEAP